MKLIAYDYDKQEWVEGEPARRLLVEQITEEIESLYEPGYWNFLSISEEEAKSIQIAARTKLRSLLGAPKEEETKNDTL